MRAIRYGSRTAYRGYPFKDNGHYVGHDEPSIKFISSAPGSGNAMTYFMRLPVNPPRRPTTSGSVTTYGELSPAPRFGLPLCDANSYPQNPCTPDSDTNSGDIGNPFAAGAAFMEMQFYPPGFTPFQDNITELPNSQTLFMNSGDTLQVSISDPAAGFTIRIKDMTTGKSGFMVASASNGFATTDIGTCNGTPNTFHAEYNTAKQGNQVPWAALEGGVLMQQEIGHFEVCNSVANQDPVNPPLAGKSTFLDKQVFDTCNGGSEGPRAKGEGPCSFTTFVCTGATTQGVRGPRACPDRRFTRGQKCEYADGNCFKAGTRTVLIDGSPTTQFQIVTGCEANRFQNGDLDFDGTPYQPNTWPNGHSNTPVPAFYYGPFDAKFHPYPLIQYETDAAGSEGLCNTFTGADCTVPPIGAKFYPFWTLSKKLAIPGTSLKVCLWNFGNVIAGVTARTFGKDAQYGTPNLARFGGTVISRPAPNPQFTMCK